MRKVIRRGNFKVLTSVLPVLAVLAQTPPSGRFDERLNRVFALYERVARRRLSVDSVVQCEYDKQQLEVLYQRHSSPMSPCRCSVVEKRRFSVELTGTFLGVH